MLLLQWAKKKKALTEKEKNATKKSEINSQCPSIANPNYVPH